MKFLFTLLLAVSTLLVGCYTSTSLVKDKAIIEKIEEPKLDKEGSVANFVSIVELENDTLKNEEIEDNTSISELITPITIDNYDNGVSTSEMMTNHPDEGLQELNNTVEEIQLESEPEEEFEGNFISIVETEKESITQEDYTSESDSSLTTLTERIEVDTLISEKIETSSDEKNQTEETATTKTIYYDNKKPKEESVEEPNVPIKEAQTESKSEEIDKVMVGITILITLTTMLTILEYRKYTKNKDHREKD